MRPWSGFGIGCWRGRGIVGTTILLGLWIVGTSFATGSGSALAAHPPPVDLALLRDVICAYETRGERRPEWAVGRAGELGVCQMRLGTARQIGYAGTPALLFDADVSRALAYTKLVMCARRYGTVRGLAWCWNRGLRAGRLRREDPYAAAIEALYRERAG